MNVAGGEMPCLVTLKIRYRYAVQNLLRVDS